MDAESGKVRMGSILQNISSPKDLKGLSLPELEVLAEEIREFIIENVSRCGGHLASSLGTVELTLAMHYVFNTPQDKILWDVGHQAYAHKIITGRRDAFRSLRQAGGVSAFINPKESPFDAFVSGHTGNAIPAASGICETMARASCKKHVIAVIGDGSLSNGLTFEGLNFAGMKRQRLIVVLNDNKMFISHRVGAIADYLSRIMTSRKVREVKEEIKGILQNLPFIGDWIYRAAKYVEGNLKGVVAEGLLFEELGFRYVGPIDGHKMVHLIQAFQNISAMNEPIFLHVVTRKGNGYVPAMRDPEHFHGIGKFDPESGEVKTDADMVTYSDVFGKALSKIARRDPRVVAISAAMVTGTGLKDFAHKYPDRIFDVGIAEGHAVTMAAGMALYGLKPVVAIYSTFLQRSYDEIIHDVALQNAPVIFAVDRAGLVGADGPTHHGAFDLAYFRSVPNFTLLVPRDQLMLEKMLVQALRIQGPVAIRYPRDRIVHTPIRSGNIKAGSAEVLKKGDRLALFCVGPLCYEALQAAEGFEGVAVVDLVYAKPIDSKTVRDLVDTCQGRFIVVEDGCTQGGVGSAVVETLRDLKWPLKFELLGIPDSFVDQGSLAQLKKSLGLDPEGISKAISRLL
jgi:1-deoxy-D-xylulose-5-phosphate synthase